MSESTALTLVKAAKEKGALVFANIENMEAKVELYRTEVTEIAFTAKDFHTINSKQMPNKAATDRIGEACGIQFIQAACRVTTETLDDPLCGRHTVYRAEAQGKIRMPDGSWRTSTVDEYEFDPVLRAMLDKGVTELNEKTKPLVAKAILEYTKVARQRAATGARLRVIRQLTGMPAAFEKDEASKPFVFTRVVQNTDYILKTPEGRTMATAQAIGMDISSLFGNRSLPPAAATIADADITPAEKTNPEPEQQPEGNGNAANLADQAAADDVDFPADESEVQQAEKTQFEELSLTLEQYMVSYKEYLNTNATKSGINPYELAKTEMSNKNATVESRGKMVERIRDFLVKKHVPGVA